jgi:hypothetical protein
MPPAFFFFCGLLRAAHQSGHIIRAIHQAAKSNVPIPTIGAAHGNGHCSSDGGNVWASSRVMSMTAQKGVKDPSQLLSARIGSCVFTASI